MGYPSAVWVVDRSELIARLSKYTSVNEDIVEKVLGYLTFGAHNIRDPDIALQPLVELKKGCFALSPLLWINSNAERNFCTLLNKIPELRQSYLELTLEKEWVLQQEIIEALRTHPYDIKFGKLSNTNLDIAIIDHEKKACACIELKWFIEPAEIREVIDRSAELKKGVHQAKKLKHHFERMDPALMSLLEIDENYRLVSFVGSRNWIGYHDVQDGSIPIIKIWHFIKSLKEFSDLSKTLDWLEERLYLPLCGKDYEVVLLDIEFGCWKSKWYGMKSATGPDINI